MAFGAIGWHDDPFYRVEDLPDVGAPLIPSGPTTQGTRFGNRLFGTGGEKRFQTWPEATVRRGVSLAGDLLSGQMQMHQPGLRREDFTDIPVPSAPTADSTWLGRVTGIAPVGAQPNDPVMEQAQDMAGLAGGGLVFGRMAQPAAVAPAVRPVVAMADSQSHGAPLAALEQGKALAVERRNKGWNTGKMAQGHDFKRPDPEPGSFDALAAEARARYAAQKTEPDSPLLTEADKKFIADGWFYEDATPAGAPVAALEHQRWTGLLDQPPAQAYKSADETAAQTAREAAAPARGYDTGGAGGGDAGLHQAAAEAARRAGAYKPLEGLPAKAMKIGDEYFVPGPIAAVREVADAYMANKPTPSYHKQPTKYHPLDEDHSRAIAKAFDEMKHDPDNPAVKASYQAMIDETKAQYEAIAKTGLKIEPIEPGMPDPYAKNPRLAAKDVADNNHLWYFPTDQGFGTQVQGGIDMSKHPMMQKTGIKLGDRELLANDLFRIVHDYFGHLKEGYGFRAAGEDNAWRSHASMYSDLARPAMTTETRGQNSWVNYGPHGDKNRKASAADTVYADQKVGLLPEWTMRDRGSPEPIIAYHGGPHSFDRFDMSKIGGGEGNQAYGHGLYFAEKDAVSEWYRHQLAGRRDPLLKKYGLESQDGADVGIMVANAGGDAASVARGLREYAESLRAEGRRDMATKNMIKRAESKADYLEDAGRQKGHMYEVAIDAPREKFMDWDRPITEQPPEVAAFFGRLGIPDTAVRPAGELYGQFAGKMGQQALSEALRAEGVPGIQYLDQASRSGGMGTRNFVTFDSPRLLRKYATGIPGFGTIGREDDR